MQRREFIILGSLVGLPFCVKAQTTLLEEKSRKEVEPTIKDVQEHLFPEGSAVPSARSMHATAYLFDAIGHKCYDKE